VTRNSRTLGRWSGPVRGRRDGGRSQQRFGGRFSPTTDIAWYSSFWAEDPLWTNRPADGVAVDRWRNAGTLRTSGAYLTADGLVLPGVAGNYASTPDSNALDITGDITLVARVAMADWTPAANQVVIGKWTSTSNQRSYSMTVQATSGVLRVDASPDGLNNGAPDQFNSGAAPTVSDGATLWIAATLVTDDGDGNRVATFWTSADGVTWALLGSQSKVGAAATYSSTAPLEFGSFATGAGQNLNGTLSVARVYSGSAFTTAGPSGSLVLDADFRTAPGATSFTAATGQPVTVLSTFSANQSVGAAQPTYRGSVAALNNRPAVDFDGTDDRLEITAGVSLAQPFSVVWIGVVDSFSTHGGVLGFNSASASRRIFVASSGGNKFGLNATNNSFSTATYLTNNAYMVRTYVSGASSALSVNGTADALSTDPGSLAIDQLILGVGRLAPSTYTNFLDGQTAFLGIFPGDITASPRWPDFKAWCRIHYNIVIA